jgi:hypothetical protein
MGSAAGMAVIQTVLIEAEIGRSNGTHVLFAVSGLTRTTRWRICTQLRSQYSVLQQARA